MVNLYSQKIVNFIFSVDATILVLLVRPAICPSGEHQMPLMMVKDGEFFAHHYYDKENNDNNNNC